ncbi:2-oxo-4-hydroxy-4-carboxy-5-ureidoimidazoline decarboxylase [Aciduricibacillus chroicocephali]|uniref:2-oxo-4-hydroxy-4-carboxy-5-ureidoimidazoline decarboxylase n=1 Tax=Aciduricibacillus chroicocephali TaxID=3054939 RepID=A0ABY9KYT6_9BACI|nr:2-oxo-4-hydroxy-4-carboxy-5-ureidoimidazoline decarboxylase [Bacillaceae bacterium 44XB]
MDKDVAKQEELEKKLGYTLEELNQKDQQGFVGAVGSILEHSPWVAEQTWVKRPFSSVDEMFAIMEKTVDTASMKKKLDLLNAHPDLGGKVKMTDESVQEQKGAGLDQLSEEEHAEFLSLNKQYTDKFGFPFIIAVKGLDKNDIKAAMQKRINNDRDTELNTALKEVYKIARFRLDELVKPSSQK